MDFDSTDCALDRGCGCGPAEEQEFHRKHGRSIALEGGVDEAGSVPVRENHPLGEQTEIHPAQRQALQRGPIAEPARGMHPLPAPRAAQGSGSGPLLGRRHVRILAAALLIAVAAILGVALWNYVASYQSTDDAQIDGHIDPLSSRIDGTVIAVHAEDDDRVRKGELLVEIDPRDYQVTVEQNRARVAQAEAQVAAAKQDYSAELAKIRESEAANYRAQRDAVRYGSLLRASVVSQQEYDQYTATARVDAAQVDAAREAAGAVFRTIASREADLRAAQAALDQAALNLSYTKIYAPANGIVGKRSVQLGSRIQPGQTLMFVTETDDIWVIANFKETQLAGMHRGELVTIHVDTFGRNYRGHVAHMPGASGDRFSLLPPENATGNYVKVVQRLPVRILLEPGQDPEHLLHPGMSVEPTVWLR